VTLTCRPNFSERLTKLKCGASPVAYVDEQVKNARGLLREMLHESRNARRNRSVMPALQLLRAITDNSQDLINKSFGRL